MKHKKHQKKNCEKCFLSYTPNSSSQKRCNLCKDEVRKQLRREKAREYHHKVTKLKKQLNPKNHKRFISKQFLENYQIDVDKIPTIAEEAWANQYESKAEAFWYGQEQTRLDLLEVLNTDKTIILSKGELFNHLKDIIEDSENSILPLEIRLEAYTQSLYKSIY